jgi:hypothetical protein
VIAFTETIDERSVMRALRVIPRIDFRESSWKEDTLRLTPDGTWPPTRATTVWIGDTAKDDRGNRLAAPILFRFTPADSLGPGTIEGRVWPGRELASVAGARMLVAAFDSAAVDSTSAAEDDPSAIALPESNGAFRLTTLIPGVYRVVGYFDADGDAFAAGRGEIFAIAPDVVEISLEAPHAAVRDFLVGTLDSTGVIAGDAVADSGAVVVEARADSSAAPVEAQAFLDAGGPFELRVATGRSYVVSGFADADGDSTRGADERWISLDEPVALDVTAERRGLVVDLRTKGKEP